MRTREQQLLQAAQQRALQAAEDEGRPLSPTERDWLASGIDSGWEECSAHMAEQIAYLRQCIQEEHDRGLEPVQFATRVAALDHPLNADARREATVQQIIEQAQAALHATPSQPRVVEADLLRAVIAASGLVETHGTNEDLHEKNLIEVVDTDDGEVGTVLTEHARKLISDALRTGGAAAKTTGA